MKNLQVGDKVRFKKAYFGFTVGEEYVLREGDILYAQGTLEEYCELVSPQPKPTAVLVTTKREFDLLMVDYEKKGYIGADIAEYLSSHPIITIDKYFETYRNDSTTADKFTILTFSEYAKIAGIEVKEEDLILSTGVKVAIGSGWSVFSKPISAIIDTDLDKLYETYKLRKG